MTLVLAETRRNASVCGCSSMAEQKLPKLLSSAENRTSISKTRRVTGLLYQRLGFSRQINLAPACLPASEGRTKRPKEGRMADRFLSQRVYFIQSGDSGPIKVGISDDPASRRRHLQTASHEPLYLLGEVPGGEEREKQIHAYLAEFRIRGEWFSPDPVVWAIVPGQRAIEMLQQMLGTDRIGASGFKLKHILAMRTGKPRSPEIEAEISRLQVGGL